MPPTLPSLPLGRPNDVDCRPAYFVLCTSVAAVAVVGFRTEVVVVVVVEVAAGDGPGTSDGQVDDIAAAAASVAADAATEIRSPVCSSL